MYRTVKILLFVILLFAIKEEAFSQNQPHLRDLRSCENRSCSSSNYTIEAVFLSDINGTPITNSLLTCEPGVEQVTYITFKYRTSTNSNVNNARLFADLKVGDQTSFLNYFFGPIPVATDVSRFITLASFPLTWTCGVEVSLLNPMMAWTTSGSDRSTSYECNNYPSAQCQFQSAIVVDAPLAVQFEYEYDCPLDGATSVRFVSTANGGREPFIYSWTFTNASIVTSNQPNPIVDFFQRGTAQLTLQDANGTTNTYYVDLPIPEALIISESTNVINSTNEENPDGGIELVLENIGSFSYAWSGPDDFFADEPAIYGLKDGVYTVTVTDEYECTFVYEFQLPAFVALPLSIDFVKLNYDESAGGVTMGWNVLDGNREYTYQIERSFGGIHDFSVVGHIASNSGGSVDGSYQFVDSAQHARDGRYYYRIKVVSVDGTKPVYISEIRMVQVSSKIGTETWDLYPNPVNGTNLYLLYRGGQLGDDRKAKIKVYSPSSGILLLLEGEIGLIDLSNSLSKMPKGLFFVEVQYGGKSEVFKVIR